MIPFEELYKANKNAGHNFTEIGANEDRTRIILKCDRCDLLIELFDNHIWELGRGVLFQYFSPIQSKIRYTGEWSCPLSKCSTDVMKNALK